MAENIDFADLDQDEEEEKGV